MDQRASELFVEAIEKARGTGEGRKFELFAWVVMPEHVHLLLRMRPGVHWAGAASAIKISVAKRVIAGLERTGGPLLGELTQKDGSVRFWQSGGGFDRSVRNEEEFGRYVTYIHRNPVERGLVARAEDWRWTSVRWWMGMGEGELECDPPPGSRAGWETWTGYV